MKKRNVSKKGKASKKRNVPKKEKASKKRNVPKKQNASEKISEPEGKNASEKISEPERENISEKVSTSEKERSARDSVVQSPKDEAGKGGGKRHGATGLIVRNIFYVIFTYLVFFLAELIEYALGWAEEEYGTVPFSQLVFHLKVPLTGTSNGLIEDFIKGFLKTYGILLILVAVILIAGACAMVLAREYLETEIGNRGRKLNVAFIIKSLFLIVFVIMLGTQLKTAYKQLGINQYIKDMRQSTLVYDDYYVDAANVEITFPKNKKNLIYIFCESLEVTYLLEKDGGTMKNELMPGLTEIALENGTFSGSRNLVNGAHEASNCGWTMAGMVAQTAGIPLSIPIEGNSYGQYSEFLPKVTSLGDILEKEGYNQMLMVGSDVTFGGRKNYFEQHGDYELFDLNTARDLRYISQNYYVHWGFEDEKLFEYAREAILDMAKEKEPFNFTMLTVDTHFPDGYLCNVCENEFGYQYENVIACADRQISEFVEWIEKQDFYEDTVIVISGDHTSMSTTVETLMTDKDYPRRTYVTIINSAVKDKSGIKREYNTMDLFPTTLASLGCTIEGDRLGLGTNLYSDTETLTELMTAEVLDEELFKMSKYYNRNILGE